MMLVSVLLYLFSFVQNKNHVSVFVKGESCLKLKVQYIKKYFFSEDITVNVIPYEIFQWTKMQR